MLYEVITTMIDALLRAGAEVNLSNNGGLAPLHVAVASGRVDIVEKLLKVIGDESYRSYAQSRITSYNVCYTKLLRFPGDRPP